MNELEKAKALATAIEALTKALEEADSVSAKLSIGAALQNMAEKAAKADDELKQALPDLTALFQATASQINHTEAQIAEATNLIAKLAEQIKAQPSVQLDKEYESATTQLEKFTEKL